MFQLVLVTLPTLRLNPVVTLTMLYPSLPPEPGVDAFQANETLLVVMAVAWKSPGVDGGVSAGGFLPSARAGKESMASARPSATVLARTGIGWPRFDCIVTSFLVRELIAGSSFGKTFNKRWRQGIPLHRHSQRACRWHRIT